MGQSFGEKDGSMNFDPAKRRGSGSWETYITGSRWQLREGTIRRGVIDSGCNVKLVYEQRVTSFMNATIFFKVEGDIEQVEEFRRLTLDAINFANGPW